MHKTIPSLVLGSALLSLPMLASAATNTVTFTGEVSTQTCEVSVNGQTQGNVLMPTVPAANLNAAGSNTGLTPFTITVTNCPTSGSARIIDTAFLGYSVNVTSGALGNIWDTPATAAGNVNIQLMTDASGTTPIMLNASPTVVPALTVPPGDTTASHTFGARYLAVGGAATAGMVKAVVEYELIYR